MPRPSAGLAEFRYHSSSSSPWRSPPDCIDACSLLLFFYRRHSSLVQHRARPARRFLREEKGQRPLGASRGSFLGWAIAEWCVHIRVQLIGRPFYISLLSLSSFSFLLSFFFILFSFFFSLLLSFHPFLYLCGDQGAARPSRVQPLFGWTCNVFFSRGPRGLSNAPGQQPWIHAV